MRLNQLREQRDGPLTSAQRLLESPLAHVEVAEPRIRFGELRIKSLGFLEFGSRAQRLVGVGAVNETHSARGARSRMRHGITWSECNGPLVVLKGFAEALFVHQSQRPPSSRVLFKGLEMPSLDDERVRSTGGGSVQPQSSHEVRSQLILQLKQLLPAAIQLTGWNVFAACDVAETRRDADSL